MKGKLLTSETLKLFGTRLLGGVIAAIEDASVEPWIEAAYAEGEIQLPAGSYEKLVSGEAEGVKLTRTNSGAPSTWKYLRTRGLRVLPNYQVELEDYESSTAIVTQNDVLSLTAKAAEEPFWVELTTDMSIRYDMGSEKLEFDQAVDADVRERLTWPNCQGLKFKDPSMGAQYYYVRTAGSDGSDWYGFGYWPTDNLIVSAKFLGDKLRIAAQTTKVA